MTEFTTFVPGVEVLSIDWHDYSEENFESFFKSLQILLSTDKQERWRLTYDKLIPQSGPGTTSQWLIQLLMVLKYLKQHNIPYQSQTVAFHSGKESCILVIATKNIIVVHVQEDGITTREFHSY